MTNMWYQYQFAGLESALGKIDFSGVIQIFAYLHDLLEFLNVDIGPASRMSKITSGVITTHFLLKRDFLQKQKQKKKT